MGHACSSVIYILKHCLVLGVCPLATTAWTRLKGIGSGPAGPPNRAALFALPGACADSASNKPNLLNLTSDQVGIPAELKHINKRRKRNQLGLP